MLQSLSEQTRRALSFIAITYEIEAFEIIGSDMEYFEELELKRLKEVKEPWLPF